MFSFDQLAASVKRYHPSPDLDLLKRAYEFAEKAHSTQIRASGEPYFLHLFSVAVLTSELKLDVPSIAAALLHDCMEDCFVSRETIEKQFGPEIADIVDGVTKLTRIEFESREEKQAENFRKMLLAMAKDIRVVLVKLCDRLHNMRTLQYLVEEKQRFLAQETRDIYAPIANRLGIHWLKSELEDLALKYLRPEMFELISSSFDKTSKERDEYVAKVGKEIQEVLDKSGVSASVKGRSKHIASIWQKMERSNLAFHEVHDVHGFRILVPSLRACYESLGILHSQYKPVPGRFKDYIAMAKPNGYQSLHTTVIGPDGQRVEVQIRTPEMHRVAEEGIAAHWRYKEATEDDRDAAGFDLQWVRELVETQQYLKNPDEFIQSVKSDLFPEEVFVFTPKGDLIRLPYEATPIDFAYAVHTDVGHHTTGARVNGSIVPLQHALENGDTVEVITNKSHVPSKDWLKFVKSSKAKQRIRAFLKSEEHARSLAIGYELLGKDLRKVKLSLKKLEQSGKILEVAKHMGLKAEGDLYVELGYGKINSSKVLARLLPEDQQIEDKIETKATPLQRIFRRAAEASRGRIGVTVSGFDDILVRFAKCCEPLPGDRILGFITRGRGVTVHHADCPQAMKSDPSRRVEVSWDITGAREVRRVRLMVHSQDQLGLLANVTRVITESGANITSAQIKTTDYGKAVNSFELAIADSKQLQKVVRGIEMVPGVLKVERVTSMDIVSGRAKEDE